MNTPFPRRLNADHSVDSICTRCYRTVSSTPGGWDLSQAEAAHLCDPERIKMIDQLLGYLPPNPAALHRALPRGVSDAGTRP